MEKNSAFMLEMTDLKNQQAEYLETLFALGNGQFGIRAGNPLKINQLYQGNPGTFINGFFESEPIQYGEWAYGYAKEHQTICKLPNLRGVIFQIDTENSSEEEWIITPVTMQLNMQQGVLYETYKIETPLGKSFELLLTSFASMTRRELFVCEYLVRNCNFTDPILMKHAMVQEGKVLETDDPRVSSKKQDLLITQEVDCFYFTTKRSEKMIAINVLNNEHIFDEQNKSAVTIFQISTIYEASSKEAITFADEVLTFEELLAEQIEAYRKFWTISDIQIKGNQALQQGIRFNLFHLNQGAGRDGKTNFAAKGLTGEGYEGHYFWDTEMYMLPFFIYTQPETAKSLLMYRANILDQAKARAQELDQSGVLFAWRTIDGQETSAYYPAGTAQVHINADIVYAFQLYERITADEVFIKEIGREVVFETAKFWLNFGDFCLKNGQEAFCINGVTGPDEYSALVNNNFYTNKMVQNNLFYAVELAIRYNMYDSERELWQKAAKKMYFGYDEAKQITKQDDDFLEQAIWDFEHTPKEKYPLLLHYHPMIIYKYQVCKQADTVLAQMLFTGDFTPEQLVKDYDYYEQVTTHDSSLSRSIFSVMASRTNQTEKAYDYFMDTALMDLTDLQGNVVDGIHAANMGGSWLSLIYGFAGLHFDQGLKLSNHLPNEIDQLTFSLIYKKEKITVTLSKEGIDCLLPENSKQIVVKTNQEIWIK